MPAGEHHAKKTHCPQGHEYDEANTYRWRTSRYCRTCMSEHNKRAKARQRARARGYVTPA